MGSSRPAEGLRNIRRTIKFARCQVKTVGMSLSLDAGRQLIDKGLRYLKTVRVTAAVYEGLARLKPGFTHSHWADITSYTKDFSLAASYVFVKQSLPPCY